MESTHCPIDKELFFLNAIANDQCEWTLTTYTGSLQLIEVRFQRKGICT